MAPSPRFSPVLSNAGRGGGRPAKIGERERSGPSPKGEARGGEKFSRRVVGPTARPSGIAGTPAVWPEASHRLATYVRMREGTQAHVRVGNLRPRMYSSTPQRTVLRTNLRRAGERWSDAD
jgi:hypothetical protein